MRDNRLAMNLGGPHVMDESGVSHEQRRLQALVAMSPAAMFEAGIDGGVSWANDRWGEIAGGHLNSAQGVSWFNAVHPDDRARVITTWRDATARQSPVDLEFRMNASGKTGRWMFCRAAPLLDPSGLATTYVATLAEVTDKHRLQEMTRTTTDLEHWAEQSAAALAEQAKDLDIFASLVSSSVDAIAIAEQQGAIRYANPAFDQLFGKHSGRVAESLISVLGLDDANTSALRLAFAAGEPFRASVTLDRAGTESIHADVSGFSVVDGAGRTIGMAVVVRDLSASWAAEVERSRLHAEIIASQEAAIRELSTPLLPIAPRVIALPLVGSINAARGQQILETLLAGIGNHHADIAILDVTGVRQMDADVADALLRAAQAARLLGADVLLTGISPFVARTLIGLGVDVGGVRTLATLEQGISAAFARGSSSHLQRRTPHARQLSHESVPAPLGGIRSRR